MSQLPDDCDDDTDRSGSKRSRSASPPGEEIKRSRRGPASSSYVLFFHLLTIGQKMSNTATTDKNHPVLADLPTVSIQKKVCLDY